MFFELQSRFAIESDNNTNITPMKIKVAGRLIMLVTVLLFTGTTAFSQSLEEAGELFNQGRELITKGDNKAAIDKLEAVVTMCTQLGETGDVLKSQAASAIPNLWYNYAKGLFDDNKVDESIAAYKTTLQIAKKYQDTETYEMTRGVLAQLFLKNGNDKFRAKDYEGSVADLTQSLAYDPSNSTTLLLMGYNMRRLDKTDEMVDFFKATITAGGTDRNANTAREQLMNHYMTTGARLLNAKNTTDGLSYLDTAATYGESGDLWYYYAVGYNAEQKYDDAIAAAEKAITLDPNNKENVAKYWFEIGTAWYAKKDNNKACEAYKSANFGRTSLRADQMLKTLKCK
jgi:tetratricopeptide (TPR) repeat protein